MYILVALLGIVSSGPVEFLELPDSTYGIDGVALPAGGSVTTVVQPPTPVKFYGKNYEQIVVRTFCGMGFNNTVVS